jgi:hypothetical protein
MKRLLVVAALGAALVGGAAAGEATSPFEGPDPPAPASPIDHLVFQRLKELGMRPANVCSDAVFVRRAYLDVIGTLPTPDEVRAFLQDKDPAKRVALVDRLLARDEFTDYWAMKWGDLLRVKAEFPINLWPNAAQAYHRWIRTSVRENKPYDRFVREMLTSSGSNFRVPQVNFYRAVQDRGPSSIAQAVALTFMGMRADRWAPERLAGMAGFFSRIGYKPTAEWKEEIILFDAAKPVAAAAYPDGTAARLAPDQDPRAVFADWLLDPKNPWLARAVTNRIWSWLLGRGIVHEPDDFRPDNPPTHPDVLVWLEKELVGSKYDLKHIYRLVLNSAVYGQSSIPRTEDPRGEAHFAFYPVRRLEAEVLIDALCQITGTTEQYSSAIPEPFTFVPEDQRSIALPDGSITSPFLEMFGRPPRDTGLESERSNRPTAAQRLHLLNSSHVQRKIQEGPGLRAVMQSGRTPRESVSALYLAILSRFPTEEELRVAAAYAQAAGAPAPGRSPAAPGRGLAARREVPVDLAWALINSAEFLYRH